MAEFKMERSYEGRSLLKTDSLLSALKTTSNYEGDLYVDGRLVFSALGLDHEYNAEVLSAYGITFAVNARHNWAFKWTDESKNVKRYYWNEYEHQFWCENGYQASIHDYRKHAEDIEAETIDEIIDHVCKKFIENQYDSVHITLWDDEHGCVSFDVPKIIAGIEDPNEVLRLQREKEEGRV